MPGALPESPSSPIVSDDAITEQGDFYKLVTTRWSRIYRSLLSRLSVLEPWDAGQPGTLTIDSNLDYSLRLTANPAFEPPHLSSLKGLNFTSGILSRPYFSALGGWGFQKAVYNNGNFTVISDTAMGRTSFYSLEIKGRISVFWHVSKLVLIYERTVVPSEQYATSGLELSGFGLQLFGPSATIAQLPPTGRNLIAIANVSSTLHFRVFDDSARMQFDTDESKLPTSLAPKVAALKTQLSTLWPPHVLTQTEISSVNSAVAAILGFGQLPLLGRPIVRLVETYVEILQPVRNYPDLAAKPNAPGFVQSVEFKSKKIRVDLDWMIGLPPPPPPPIAATDPLPSPFKIPLWQTDADPKIYPKPHVVSRHAAPPGSGLQDSPHEIAEPEKLFFYSEWKSTESNTDKWQPVQNVDFPPKPLPDNPLSPGAMKPGAGISKDPNNPDGPPAGPPATPSENADFDPFTLALNPSSIPTNLTQARSTTAIASALETITMVRCAPLPIQPATATAAG